MIWLRCENLNLMNLGSAFQTDPIESVALLSAFERTISALACLTQVADKAPALKTVRKPSLAVGAFIFVLLCGLGRHRKSPPFTHIPA